MTQPSKDPPMTDAPLEAHEHVEHAEHAAHAKNPFIAQVSITVAMLAVIAAIAGSLETYESGAAIIAANEAVLDQDRATDQWNLYQAKSLKKNMFAIAADADGARADDYRAKAKDEGQGQDQAQLQARQLETLRDHTLAVSATHERRHHRLSLAATLLEMGIALSTIAIVTQKRWPWLISVALGAVGAVAAGAAYLS
jgi:hypothetical protein